MFRSQHLYRAISNLEMKKKELIKQILLAWKVLHNLYLALTDIQEVESYTLILLYFNTNLTF